MKKGLTYALLIIGCLILVGGGYILYAFKFKEYDVADAQVDEIINENIEVPLPDGTKLVLDSQGNIIEEIAPTAESSINEFEIEGKDIIVQTKDGIVMAVLNKNHEPVQHETIKIGQTIKQADNNVVIVEDTHKVSIKPESVVTNTGKAPTNVQAVEETVASIKGKYQGSFETLEGQARGRLGSLIDQAKAEYNAKKAAGESISYSYFYQKYYGAATSMEAVIDASFNTLYARLESELEKNQFDKAHAQSFKDQYAATKSSLKSELLSKIK